VNSPFAIRFRWGLLVGALIAGGIVAKDIVLGEWQGLDTVRMLTLGLTVLIAAAIWAWLMGRIGNRDA
jgi:hypothetical protein